MGYLITGAVVFFGIHCVPLTPLKGRLVGVLGEGGYTGAFSLLSLAGLAGLIIGFGRTEFIPLWDAPGFCFGLSVIYWRTAI